MTLKVAEALLLESSPALPRFSSPVSTHSGNSHCWGCGSCCQVFGLLWSEFHQFVHTQQDEGEEPETPADRRSNPAVLIHGSSAAQRG